MLVRAFVGRPTPPFPRRSEIAHRAPSTEYPLLNPFDPITNSYMINAKAGKPKSGKFKALYV